MMNKKRISTTDIAQIGSLIALIEASKLLLLAFPNIELTTFWLILFTLYLGPKILIAIPAFILIEGLLYGFGLWWIMYLYVWPLLVILVLIFKKYASIWFYVILSSVFGLFFGLFCSIPYFFIGLTDGGISSGLSAAFTWWIAGIQYDIIHCIGNFVSMLVLYHPITNVMKRFK